MREKLLWFTIIFFSIPSLIAAQSPDQSSAEKYEAGLLFTGTFLREIGSRDAGIGTDAAGFGGRMIYHAIKFVDLETELNFLPGNSATSGNHVQGFFGAKAGARFERLGVFIKARPGFIHFRRDPFGAGTRRPGAFTTDRATSTERSGDIGGVVEYYMRRGLILRFDLGDTVIRYHRRTVQISDFVPGVQAGGFTTHNWQGSFGMSVRF